MCHAVGIHHVSSSSGGGGGSGGSMLLLLVASSRVGVVVYPRVPGELVGPAESFGASGERACMGLLAGMGADVTGLVLEAVEGLLAQRTLVGAGQVLTGLVVGLRSGLEKGSHQAHRGRRHGGVRGSGWRVVGEGGVRGRGWLGEVVVEDAGEVSKTCRRVGVLHVISTSGVSSKKVGLRWGGARYLRAGRPGRRARRVGVGGNWRAEACPCLCLRGSAGIRRRCSQARQVWSARQRLRVFLFGASSRTTRGE